MPYVPLTSESKIASNTDSNKLSLDRGERALIVAVEKQPIMEYRHVYQAPELDAEGNVVKEEATNYKGEKYDKIKNDFFGQHLCFGDFGVLRDKGVDPQNCPGCARAEEEAAIKPPTPYYAMNVFRYKLKPNSWDLAEPFTGEVIPWTFGPSRLNTLIEIAEDLKEGDDIRRHDLRLGPCENKQYQKYQVQVSTTAKWLEGESDAEIEERKKYVAKVYSSNRVEDLSTMVAKRVSKGEALEMINQTVARYNEAYNRNASVNVPDVTAQQSSEKTSDEKVNVNITTGEVTEKSDSEKELTSMDFADILADL